MNIVNQSEVETNAVKQSEVKTSDVTAPAPAQGTEDLSHLKMTLDGIGASQAMIEFETDGTIITANENFLRAMGYSPQAWRKVLRRQHGPRCLGCRRIAANRLAELVWRAAAARRRPGG